MVLCRLKPVFLDGVCHNLGGVGLSIGLDAAGFGGLFSGVEVCVGGKFDGTARTLSLGHGGAAGTLGVKLLEHRVAGGLVEVHVQQFSARDLNAPIVNGGFDRDLNLMNKA